MIELKAATAEVCFLIHPELFWEKSLLILWGGWGLKRNSQRLLRVLVLSWHVYSVYVSNVRPSSPADPPPHRAPHTRMFVVTTPNCSLRGGCLEAMTFGVKGVWTDADTLFLQWVFRGILLRKSVCQSCVGVKIYLQSAGTHTDGPGVCGACVLVSLSAGRWNLRSIYLLSKFVLC